MRATWIVFLLYVAVPFAVLVYLLVVGCSRM